jgi:murein DD-endopeptidase MepM/ murein hydrolase activator NlpD
MIEQFAKAALAAALSLVVASPGFAAVSCPGSAPAVGTERLFGSAYETEQTQADLPFTRRFSADGLVTGSLAQSAASAGVPLAALLEPLRAIGTAIDLERDLQDGDSFHVRYEQTFTLEDRPIGVARVLWAEVRTAAKDTIAVYRFRARDGIEQFWLPGGQAASAPAMRLPLDVVSVTSGFGMRSDPLGYGRPPAGLGGQWNGTGRLYMHDGVDLVALVGTPVHAAADGVITLAGRDQGYGNAVRIDHGCGERTRQLSTIYGHLSRFAPGIVAGAKVMQGDLIGFSGNTGRSTGPHLHFEVQSKGKPVNPLKIPATQRGQLTGVDLAGFRRQVAAALDERERESEQRSNDAAVEQLDGKIGALVF